MPWSGTRCSTAWRQVFSASRLRADRIKQLELIGKHVDVSAFVERKEIGGIGGGPVQVEDLTPTEAARRILFVLAKAEAEQDNS